MGEAAGAVPQEGDWETIASTGELVCEAQMERVGEGNEIELL